MASGIECQCVREQIESESDTVTETALITAESELQQFQEDKESSSGYHATALPCYRKKSYEHLNVATVILTLNSFSLSLLLSFL